MLQTTAWSPRRSSLSALAIALLTIAAMVTGALLLRAVGGSSGRDIGASANSPELVRALPILAVAEALKIAIAVAQVLLVLSTLPPHSGRQRVLLGIFGFAGAALLASSGIAGLYSIAAAAPAIGPAASALAFVGAGLSGLWVLLIIWFGEVRLRRWQSVIGVLFGIASLASVVVAPIAMAAGLLSLVWWFALASALRSLQGESSRKTAGVEEPLAERA